MAKVRKERRDFEKDLPSQDKMSSKARKGREEDREVSPEISNFRLGIAGEITVTSSIMFASYGP